ncbi:MAG TPA: ankyrin repeat domain-containing protein [Sulfuricurvum sp.]|nr:ankyrin repeat domain-containing protein [Sulfuricurvum sp.]
MKSLFNGLVLVTAVLLASGCTTLHTAAAKGNINAIDRLVGEENDMNALDDSGETPLIQAIKMNQQASVHSLLKYGANVDTADSVLGNTPLHHAIVQGNSKLVTLLLKYNADITLQNYDKKTPLDFAREKNSEAINSLMAKVNQPLLPKADVVEITKATIEKSPTKEIVPQEPKHQLIRIQEVSPIVIPKDAQEVLNGMIARRETKGIRNYLDSNPQAIVLITDPKQQLRYIGPSGWRVIDIVEKIQYGKIPEKSIIEYISSNALIYKNFTQDEMKILSKYGLTSTMIASMMHAN